MNTYVFSDIKVGMEESFEIEITKEMSQSDFLVFPVGHFR